MTDKQRPFQNLRGEELRQRARRAASALGTEIDRVRLSDERFRTALDLSLALDDELENRRNA